MSIHLTAIEGGDEAPAVTNLAAAVEPVWFVIQRANGDWSPAAKILHVFQTEESAEREALHMKRIHPAQNFGVAMLRSEAREAPEPFQIVRVA